VLASLKSAIDDGIPVIGCMHWSLPDNFEWMLAYGQQFGLASVDQLFSARSSRALKSWAALCGPIRLLNGGNDVQALWQDSRVAESREWLSDCKETSAILRKRNDN